ncbi:MAG: LacI family DNA-binding transcriptional regulator [Balneolaceae bacterium]
MQSKPSIKDIAKRANVSIGTVDRVLHNRGQVSEATREKVQKVIEELNYEPNIIARSLASKQDFNIGILLPRSSSKNDYWYYPAVGIQKAAAEHQYVGLNLVEAYYDLNLVESFQDKISLLSEKDLDGVITAPIYKNELEDYINQLENSNIKYSLLDSDLEDSQRSFFVGQDPVQSGRVAAQLIDFTLQKDSPDILTLHFNPVTQGIPTINLREDGFSEYFNHADTEVKVSSHLILYTSKEELNSKLDQIFTDVQNLKAIFVPDSKSYLVAEYLENKTAKDVVLAGFDLLEENATYLRKGVIDFIINQQPITQGYQALNQLINSLIQKKEKIPSQNIPIDIITSENIKYYDGLD